MLSVLFPSVLCPSVEDSLWESIALCETEKRSEKNALPKVSAALGELRRGICLVKG